jgi:hypothetical protein
MDLAQHDEEREEGGQHDAVGDHQEALHRCNPLVRAAVTITPEKHTYRGHRAPVARKGRHTWKTT